MIHTGENVDNKLMNFLQWKATVIPVDESIISTSKWVKVG
jgi:hypothetical protein